MLRKINLILGFAVLAIALMGCELEQKNTPVERSPTMAFTTTIPTNSPVLLPTEVPATLPEATNTIEAPTPLPATETPLPATDTPLPLPLPALTGPVLAHLESGQPVTIRWIHMLEAANGWAIGGQGTESDHVLLTADGGQTWRDVTPPEPAPADGSLAALGYFADAGTAWVIYYSQNEMVVPSVAVVWRTQDGGQTWQSSSPLDLQGLNELYMPSDLAFADAQNGWLLVHVGAGMSHDYVTLFHTQDGGQTWARLLDPYGGSEIQVCYKDSLVFSSAQNGWLTGTCNGVMAGAFLYQTSDGGQTWQSVTLSAPADAPKLFADSGPACGTQSLKFFSPQVGTLIVSCKDFSQDPAVTSYYLYTTQDGGADWVSTSSPAGALDFVTGKTGWALSRDLFHTTDGGQTWTKVKTVNWDGQFSFVSDDLGWAVARAETDTTTLIALVQTTDSGKTWTEIYPVIAP
jgi:photosystem II stability/assembly factor-like uncharacterized protein